METLSGVIVHVTPSSAATIEYPIGIATFAPGTAFDVHVSNACADSNSLPLQLQ